MVPSSKNLSFEIDENQSFKLSTVSFNSTEKGLASEVDFLHANTALAASFNCEKRFY